jgi:hypothetical protein
MGMMMLGRLIMNLVGDRDSWNQASLMIGMMGMRGGMGGGMGGMGGGMGGMGGGMGGMGGGMGGFGSVPPTGVPYASLTPGQTRHLPTRLVNLGGPTDNGVSMPAKGERLQLGDIADLSSDPKVQEALRRLARDKAPTRVSQLVAWKLATRLDWDAIQNLSSAWANPFEIALAKGFVAAMDAPKGSDDTGRFFVEVNAADPATATEVLSLFKGRTLLGVKVEEGVPAKPGGPALACKIAVNGDGAKVEVTRSNGHGQWVPAVKFDLKIGRDAAGKHQLAAFGDALAESLVGRLVEAKLTKTRSNGKDAYRVKILNRSPLILNGLALSGDDPKDVKMLTGFCVSPQRDLTFPASGEVVERLGLKHRIRLLGADLSGL